MILMNGGRLLCEGRTTTRPVRSGWHHVISGHIFVQSGRRGYAAHRAIFLRRQLAGRVAAYQRTYTRRSVFRCRGIINRSDVLAIHAAIQFSAAGDGRPNFSNLILLYVPQFSPAFCFFRPTIRQFPELQNDLRFLSGNAEIAKVHHMGLFSIMFFGVISLTFKELGSRAAVWQFIIIAPFFWMAVLQSTWRDSRWICAERLAQKLAPNAPREMRNVGSWSNKFAHSYLFDVCFILSIILAQILVQ